MALIGAQEQRNRGTEVLGSGGTKEHRNGGTKDRNFRKEWA
jgi:hypothetical protein